VAEGGDAWRSPDYRAIDSSLKKAVLLKNPSDVGIRLPMAVEADVLENRAGGIVIMRPEGMGSTAVARRLLPEPTQKIRPHAAGQQHHCRPHKCRSKIS
jgi:hypothetical protein